MPRMGILNVFSCDCAVVWFTEQREGRRNGVSQTTHLDGIASGNFRARRAVRAGSGNLLRDGSGNSGAQVQLEDILAGSLAACEGSAGAAGWRGSRECGRYQDRAAEQGKGGQEQEH